jgi:N-acyl homoserine lactone hydrolase
MAKTKWLVVLTILTICQACSLSDHPIVQSNLGRRSSFIELEKVVDTPGPIEVETVNSADWTVPLAGLVNLKSASAKAAHLIDRPEPIHVFAHILRHPKFGTYLVDTGVSQHIMDDPSGSGLSWLVRQVMPLDKMVIRQSTAQIIAGIPGGIQGVFFTHLHVDHISGMPDIPGNVPLYVGPTESTQTSFQNAFVRGTTTKLSGSDSGERTFLLDIEYRYVL